METEKCWKFRLFWAWQEEQEEKWLTEMSRAGWHLSAFGIFGVYNFRKGTPKNFAYRLDYQSSTSKDRQAYLQLFQDAGWEHLGNLSAWEYFRKETKPGEEPEIFTDPESKIQKYHRIVKSMVITLPFLILLPNICMEGNPLWENILQGISIVLLFLYVISLVAIFLRINQLKNTIRK
jgi:hypothetical protein